MSFGHRFATMAELVAERRRFVAAAVLLPPVTLASSLGLTLSASAAGVELPRTVRSLDSAATALFDAAEAANWADAEQALGRVKTAALEVTVLQPAFLAAGGAISHFIEAQNNLGGDLIEAGIALSARDQHWLISSADRIESRAGELSQPFLDGTDTIGPRVETLLFLARRMRRALVWHDDRGYRQASDDFKRMASSLRADLDKRSPGNAHSLQLALERISDSPSSVELKSLYDATLRLRHAAPCQVDCPS